MKRIGVVVAVAFMAIGAGVLLWLSGDSNNTQSSEPKLTLIDEVSPPQPEQVSSRILFGGDVFLGRRIQTWSLESKANPYARPFTDLSSLEPEKYQAWIANLECPSTYTDVPMSEQETILRFNCKPEFLPELARWFDVVSLSNNHTDNVNGTSGLRETRQNLAANNIQYFGHYDNAVKKDICEVVAIDTVIKFDDQSTENAALPIALCGYHGLFKIPLKDEIAVISDYAKWLPTFVMPHMGVEYRPSNDQLRQRIYRNMIDAGADAVIAGHPHWVQNTESYNGKLIAYSLGNLIFDQQFSTDVMRSAMIDLQLTLDYDSNVQGWLDLAGGCRDFQDDCLDRADDQGLVKPKYEIVYDIVATQNDGFNARKAEPATEQAVLKRTDWIKTKTTLE